MDNQIAPLYHGSDKIVQYPDLSKSRAAIDFGPGFYLTKNKGLSSKWACNKKNNAYLNEYTLDTTDLKIKVLKADKEWLHFVAGNRTGKPEQYPLFFDAKEYDVIIGPIADDKLFFTIDLYLANVYSAEKTIRILNCMEYGNQVVLISQKAVEQLEFATAKKFSLDEQQKYKKASIQDAKDASAKTARYMREIDDIWEEER